MANTNVRYIKVRIINAITGREDRMLLDVNSVVNLIESRRMSPSEIARAREKGSGPNVGEPGTLVELSCGTCMKVVETIDEITAKLAILGIEMV